MAESKKYYWIKLKTDFFDQDTIDFLMGQENGAEYVVIYQMLILKTAQQGGYLGTKMAEAMIPYDIKKIVRDTKYFDYDTVTIALELFKKLGLVYEESNHILKLAGAEQLVGSESKWAEKKRIYRDSQRTIQGQIEDNVRQEIDIDKEKDIEIDIDKEKDIEIDIDKEKDIEIDIDTDKKKKKKSSKADLDGMIDSFTENEQLKEALKAFLDMRKSIKKPIQTEYAFKLALNKLKQLSDIDSVRIEIVNQSVEHNWRTFYTLQNSYRTNTEVEMPDYMKKQEKGDIVSTPVNDETLAKALELQRQFKGK
jgi:predicted phage replisome organizer